MKSLGAQNLLIWIGFLESVWSHVVHMPEQLIGPWWWLGQTLLKLVQIVRCWLMAPNLFLKQYWIIINVVLWPHLGAALKEIVNITEIFSLISYSNSQSHSPGHKESMLLASGIGLRNTTCPCWLITAAGTRFKIYFCLKQDLHC